MLITVEPQNGAKNKNAEAHFRNPCSYKMKSVYKQSRKTMVEPIIFVRSPAKVFLGLNKSIVTLIIKVRSYELFLPPQNTNVHLIIIVRSGRNVCQFFKYMARESRKMLSFSRVKLQ